MNKGARSGLKLLMGWLLAVLSFSAVAFNCAMPGKDGAGGTLSGTINTYWPGAASAGAGATSISLGASIGAGAGIAVGDLLLVIQMQDAAINSSNTDAYGDGVGGDPGSGSTNLNSAGLAEFVRATSSGVSGGTVNIVGGNGAGLLNSYNNANASITQGQRRFQVVRVPQYTTATLGSGLTAAPWNGSAGGVLAFDVAGQLMLGNAAVRVDGLGFRGGGARKLLGGTTGTSADYVTSSAIQNNGSKGEGIAGTPKYLNNGGTDVVSGALLTNLDEGYPNGSHARGAPGNAGGGGTDGNAVSNNQNTGGGGGANAGDGGKGGNGWSSRSPTGGWGGFGYLNSLALGGRLFLGGGGGAGTSNDGTGLPSEGFASSGAAGGGLVMIRAGSITGTGTISANGSNANNNVVNDGSGGGGAGGSVLVYSSAGSVGSLTIQANGGKGGTNTGGGSPHGPGGGGSGGFVVTSGTASIAVVGGAPGTTSGGTSFGATAGNSGASASVNSSQIPGVKSGSECAIVIVKIFSSDPTTVANGSTLTITLTSNNDIPITGVALSDVFPTSPSAMVAASPLAITNTCGGGTFYDSRGKALRAGDASIRITGVTLAANSSCSFSVNVSTTVVGSYINTIAVGTLTSNNGGTNGVPASDTLLVYTPSLMLMKIVSATSDPVNMATNPKNIPGAEVLYTLRLSNTGMVIASVNSIVITDPIPANTELFVGDLGRAGSGPIAFVQGAPSSGLTWSASDVTFSNIDCITFGYTPVPVANADPAIKYDPAVKCIRLNPKGTLATASAGSNPFFELRFRVRIK